jgi:hypothetical protein
MQIELTSKQIGAIISGLEHDYDHNAYSGSAEFLVKMITHQLESLGSDSHLVDFYKARLDFYITEYNHYCEEEQAHN